MRPILLIDCDGVLSDFVTHVVATLRDLGLGEYSPEQVDRFDFAAALGLTPIVIERLHREIEGFSWCARMPALRAARDLDALRDQVDVVCVSCPWATSRYWAGERIAWLEEHAGFEARDIVQCRRKRIVHGDVLVDDHVETVEHWQADHPRGIGLLWENPHNVVERRFYRGRVARNMHDVLEALQEVAP